MQSVRDLYASAAYEDALSAVGKIDGGGASTLEAEQYRIFCLVALGRMDEAEQAVESVLTAHPEYRPDAAQASPRIQSLFAQVRRRIGPALVKRMYQQGRGAMERRIVSRPWPSSSRCCASPTIRTSEPTRPSPN